MTKNILFVLLLLFISSCSTYTNFMDNTFGPGEKRTTWEPPDLDIAEGYNYFIVGVIPGTQYVNLFYPFEDKAVWSVYSGCWTYQYGAFRRQASPFYIATHRYSGTSSPGEVLKFHSKDLFPDVTNRDWALGNKVILLVIHTNYKEYGVTASVYDVSSPWGSYYLKRARNQEPIVMFKKLYRYF